jgi:hypothetical protein
MIKSWLLMIKVEHELIWVHNICKGGMVARELPSDLLPLSSHIVHFGCVTRPNMGCQVNRTIYQKFDSGCKYGLVMLYTILTAFLS